MIRNLLLAAAALLATPAMADEIRIVSSATPIVVRDGDTLVTAKPLVERKSQDGTITRRYTTWIDRVSGKGFMLEGTDRLRLVGWVPGKGWVYAPVGAPVAEKPPVVVAPSLPTASAIFGINLAGGEFNKAEDGRFLPKVSELQAYYDAGFRAFRIPFKAAQWDMPAKREMLIALGNACVALNTPCIFDRHEYDQRKVPGSTPFWLSVSKAMPQSDLIGFELMNEPAWFDSIKITNDYDQFANDGQQIVTDMRAAGITNPIYIGGPQSSAAYRIDKGERPGKACESVVCSLRKLPSGTLVDPLGKTKIVIHRYFNKGGSGVNDYCEQGTNLLAAAQSLARLNLQAAYTEGAFGSDRGYRPQCFTVGTKAIAEIRQAGMLVTWWGGGTHWPRSYLHYTPANAALPYVKLITGR